MSGLQAALDELERTDPAVAAAAARYDDAMSSLRIRLGAGVGRWTFRQGRKVAEHVYLQRGAEPSDADEPLFTAPSPHIAALVCIAVNEHLSRTRGV